MESLKVNFDYIGYYGIDVERIVIRPCSNMSFYGVRELASVKHQVFLFGHDIIDIIISNKDNLSYFEGSYLKCNGTDYDVVLLKSKDTNLASVWTKYQIQYTDFFIYLVPFEIKVMKDGTESIFDLSLKKEFGLKTVGHWHDNMTMKNGQTIRIDVGDYNLGNYMGLDIEALNELAGNFASFIENNLSELDLYFVPIKFIPSRLLIEQVLHNGDCNNRINLTLDGKFQYKSRYSQPDYVDFEPTQTISFAINIEYVRTARKCNIQKVLGCRNVDSGLGFDDRTLL